MRKPSLCRAAASLLALFGLLASASAGAAVLGNVDGFYPGEGGRPVLSGWACESGNSASIQVDVFVDAPYPRGQFVGRWPANAASESAVGASCASSGTAHRFAIAIQDRDWVQFAGKSVYVHGVAPNGNAPIGTPGAVAMPSGGGAATCQIHDLASLNTCVANRAQYQVFNFNADVACAGAECCTAASSGGALLNLDFSTYKVVQGNGHTLSRYAPRAACPAININQSSYIRVSDLAIDEDENVPGCRPEDDCPSVALVSGSNNVDFQGLRIYHGKGYAIYVSGTRVFNFNRSLVADSGIIGLYVGTVVGDFSVPSRYITVTDSVFTHTRTNAIAFQGVYGDAPGHNLIRGNVLTGNHYKGMWLDPQGREINGGQLYLPNSAHVVVQGNIIGDGYCATCESTDTWGMELGAEDVVRDLDVSGNYLYNIKGMAFFLNANGAVDSDSSLLSNRVLGVSVFKNFAVAESGNVFSDTNPSLKRNGDANYVIHRSVLNGWHQEANIRNERGASFESGFGLSSHSRPKAEGGPILRCFKTGSATEDFPTRDRNCEGMGVLHSVLGYSFEPTYVGAQPFYRCRSNQDYFVSWDPGCEGKVNEGMLGYATVR